MAVYLASSNMSSKASQLECIEPQLWTSSSPQPAPALYSLRLPRLEVVVRAGQVKVAARELAEVLAAAVPQPLEDEAKDQEQ